MRNIRVVTGPESTPWSLIRKAAAGLPPDREDFARLYEPVARAYFLSRWKSTPLLSETEDAVQEVFLACFREGGPLSRADASRPGGFRAYFRGILRNTAHLMERRRARRKDAPGAAEPPLDDLPAEDPGVSTAFDRAWAEAVLRAAAERHRERAEEAGPESMRRFELLRRRFSEGETIRDIAADWGVEAEVLSEQLRRAKREFKEALIEVVRHLGADGEGGVERVEQEVLKLIDALC